MKKMLKKIILFVRDFPKSLYINFIWLPFKQAIKLPIKINGKTKIENFKKNSIIIESEKIFYSMINIGYQGCKFISENKMYIGINNGGCLIFKGKCTIAEGVNIFIDRGVCTIGNNVYINRNLLIQSENNILIDDNCLIGWNVNIRDTDGHVTSANKFCLCNDIYIGKSNWIASDVTILKSTTILDNSIIGCNSFLYKLKCEKNNLLIGCNPLKIIK